MSAAENTVSAICEPIEVELAGSKDLRRTLCVMRSRYGQISIYVRPQRPKHRLGMHRGWFEATAAVSVGQRDAAEQIAIRYGKYGPALWVGSNVWFDLLPAEADELIAKFGFSVRRESQA